MSSGAHLSDNDLERYRNRTMAPRELLKSDTHLAECRDCYGKLAGKEEVKRALASLHTAFANAARPQVDHLTFDEMAAYVGETISRADRDSADSHLETCGQCRSEIVDLTSVNASIVMASPRRYSPSKPQVNGTAPKRSFPVRLSIEVAAAAAIAALCIWLGSILESGQGSRLRGQLAELQRQNAELRGQQGSVEELQARVTELQIENSALRQSGPLQTTIALNDAGGRIELDKQGGISGISMSSPHEEETLKAALTAGHITTPAFLKELRGESGTLMGASNDASGLLSPVGTVVLSTRPKFRWRSLSGAGSYTVSIYDSEHREVTSSQPLAVSQWTSASTLERGKIYTWQVRTVKDGQELVMPPQSAPEARFKVIEQGKAAEAEHARKTYRGSHLMLGLAYAEIGLLDEAEGEFNALVAANPKSAVARKLLQNVRALRRSV